MMVTLDLPDEAVRIVESKAKWLKRTHSAVITSMVLEFEESSPEDRVGQAIRRRAARSEFLSAHPDASREAAWTAGYRAGWMLFQTRKKSSLHREGTPDEALDASAMPLGPPDLSWEETARQMARDRQYYRDLVVEIGAMFGPPAYMSDDGSVQDGVLCAKVPELVRGVLTERDVARARADAVHDAARRSDGLVMDMAQWRHSVLRQVSELERVIAVLRAETNRVT